MSLAPVSSTSSVPTPASGPPKQELGQEEFLKLLMTQMQNQDPFNPLDADQFMNQVTSMNALQQQIASNDLLSDILFGLSALNNESAVALVGHEVVARGDTFTLAEGETQDLSFELAGAADTATVVIEDENGDVVRRLRLGETPAGDTQIAWDGRDDDGNLAAPGTYRFRVEAAADGVAVTTTTFVQGRVEELRFDDGIPQLVVDGHAVGIDAVLRVLGNDTPESTPNPATQSTLDRFAAALHALS
jgi:flagellar basal-body rod modification protein FlgD